MPAKQDSFFYGTGRRKTSAARVFLRPGGGGFSVKSRASGKKKSLKEYFKKPEQLNSAAAPLKVLNLETAFDTLVTVKGGGFAGQAEAIRQGLARALLKKDESYRAVFKKHGFLTRDSRMVERKKYGRHKARKSHQFSKR